MKCHITLLRLNTTGKDKLAGAHFVLNVNRRSTMAESPSRQPLLCISYVTQFAAIHHSEPCWIHTA